MQYCAQIVELFYDNECSVKNMFRVNIVVNLRPLFNEKFQIRGSVVGYREKNIDL